MMFFVTQFTSYQVRKKSSIELMKRLPNFTNTLLPDEKAVQQLIHAVELEVEDVNAQFKAFKPMRCVVTDLLHQGKFLAVETTAVMANPNILTITIAKVEHTWNNEKGGIE